MTDYLRKLREELVQDPEADKDPSRSNKLQQINQLELILSTLNPHGATVFTPLYTGNKTFTNKSVLTHNKGKRGVTGNENKGQSTKGKASSLSSSKYTASSVGASSSIRSTKEATVNPQPSSSLARATVLRSSPVRSISPTVNRIKPINSSTIVLATSRTTESVIGTNKYTLSTHNSLEHYPFQDHQRNVVPEILYGAGGGGRTVTGTTTSVPTTATMMNHVPVSAVNAYIASTVSPPTIIGRSFVGTKNDDSTIGRSVSRFRGPRRGRSREEIRHEELLYQITAMNAIERQRSRSRSRIVVAPESNTMNPTVDNNTVASFEITLDSQSRTKNAVPPPHPDKVLPPFFQPMQPRSISRERKVVIKEPVMVSKVSESTQTENTTEGMEPRVEKNNDDNYVSFTTAVPLESIHDNSSFEAAEEYDRSLNNDSSFAAADELDKSEGNLLNIPLTDTKNTIDLDQPIFGGIEYQHLGDTDDEDDETEEKTTKTNTQTKQNNATDQTVHQEPNSTVPSSPVKTNVPTPTKVTPSSPSLDVDNSIISVPEPVSIPPMPTFTERPPSRQSRRPPKTETAESLSHVPEHTTSLSSSLKRPVPPTKKSPTVNASSSVLASTQADYKPRYPSWWEESQRFTGSHTHAAGSLKMNPELGLETKPPTTVSPKPKKLSSGYGSLPPFAFHRVRDGDTKGSYPTDTIPTEPEGYVHPNLWPHMLRTVDPKADITYHHPTHVTMHDTNAVPPPTVPVLVPNATKTSKPVHRAVNVVDDEAHVAHNSSSFVSEIPLKDTLVPKGGKPMYVRDVPSRIGDQVRLHRQQYKQQQQQQETVVKDSTTANPGSSSTVNYPNWLILANETNPLSSTKPATTINQPTLRSTQDNTVPTSVSSSTALNTSQISYVSRTSGTVVVPPPRVPAPNKKAIAWTVGSDPRMETIIATQLAEHTIGANKINADLPMMNVKVKIGDFTAKLDRADPVEQIFMTKGTRGSTNDEETFREVTHRAIVESETLHLSVEQTARRVIDMVMTGEVPLTDTSVTNISQDEDNSMNVSIDEQNTSTKMNAVPVSSVETNIIEKESTVSSENDNNGTTVSVPETSNKNDASVVSSSSSAGVTQENESIQQTLVITKDVMQQVDKAVALARAQADAAAAFAISNRGSSSPRLSSPLSSPVTVVSSDRSSNEGTTAPTLTNENITGTTEEIKPMVSQQAPAENAPTTVPEEVPLPVTETKYETVDVVTAVATVEEPVPTVPSNDTIEERVTQDAPTTDSNISISTSTEVPIVAEVVKDETVTVTEAADASIVEAEPSSSSSATVDSESTISTVEPVPSLLPTTTDTTNTNNDDDNGNEDDKEEENTTGTAANGTTNTGKKLSRSQRKKNKKGGK